MTSTPTNYTAAAPVRDRPVRARRTRCAPRQAAGPASTSNVHRKVYQDGKLLREDDFFTRYVPQNPTAIYGGQEAAGAVLLPALERVVR